MLAVVLLGTDEVYCAAFGFAACTLVDMQRSQYDKHQQY